MGNDNYVVKKRSSWGTVIKAIVIIAVIAFVAYKIYDKFFRKKVQQEVLGENADGAADAVSVEASASDVIAEAE